MGALQHSAIRPRKVTHEDQTLRCAVRRIYGYEAYCACGWVVHTYRTVHDAQLERSFHRCEDVSPMRGAEAS